MAGTIPRAFIDDLITRIDIVDLIDSYIPLKRAGRSFLACCPFHQEKTPSFNVSSTKQFYHCFGCGANGNAISFMMNYRNLEFRDAIEELASRAGLQVPHENQSAAFKNNYGDDLYSLLSKVAEYYQQQLFQSPQAEKARDYLKSRKLSGTVIKNYQLGYALDGWNHLSQAFPKFEKDLIKTGMLVPKEQGRPYDQYRDRIIFPIHDRRGRIIAFGGRVIDNKLPKYINSPETTLFHKSKALYGLYQVAQVNPHPDYIYIVEGYMDVIALAQQGIFQAVAALGTATTRDHVQSLLRYTKQLIFCFDGDNAGRKAAWKALESALPYLDAQVNIQFMFLPEGDDPDSFVRREGKEPFERQPKKALDVFFFETLTEQLDLSTMADCGKLVERAKSYFEQIPLCAYRDLMMEQLARFVRMDPSSLEKQMKNQISHPLIKPIEKKMQPVQKRTNARLALALLIQYPELIEQIHQMPSPDSMDPKSGKILCELMTVLRQSSLRTTGQLLEYYREHAYFQWISQLAVFPHGVPETGILAEFLGAVENMQKEYADKKIKTMLQRKYATDYSPEERQQLLEMIQKNKHTKPVVL